MSKWNNFKFVAFINARNRYIILTEAFTNTIQTVMFRRRVACMLVFTFYVDSSPSHVCRPHAAERKWCNVCKPIIKTRSFEISYVSCAPKNPHSITKLIITHIDMYNIRVFTIIIKVRSCTCTITATATV